MTSAGNPHRHPRLAAVWEDGAASERGKKEKKLLTRAQVQAMSLGEMTSRMDEIDAWQAAGCPDGDDDD